jgi:hypothetical protein
VTSNKNHLQVFYYVQNLQLQSQGWLLTWQQAHLQAFLAGLKFCNGVQMIPTVHLYKMVKIEAVAIFLIVFAAHMNTLLIIKVKTLFLIERSNRAPILLTFESRMVKKF